MTAEVTKIINMIVGLPCTRKEVGSMRSISLGFGGESLELKKTRKRNYRLWELGTYAGDWTVLEGSSTVIAKKQSMNIGELDSKLEAIPLGRLASVQELSKSAIRVSFDNGFAIEFNGDIAEDDEYFYVFGPESTYLEFSEHGWQVGRSDAPWSPPPPR